MQDHTHVPSGDCADPVADNRLSATINGKIFIPSDLTALACLRSELAGARTQKIWKLHAVGKVGHRRTVLGLFIDQSLGPGTYDLVRDERLSVVYHVTPRQFHQIFHAHDFQSGTVTLLECSVETGHLRGTFEINMPAADLEVTDGSFDVHCQPVNAPASAK